MPNLTCKYTLQTGNIELNLRELTCMVLKILDFFSFPYRCQPTQIFPSLFHIKIINFDSLLQLSQLFCAFMHTCSLIYIENAMFRQQEKHTEAISFFSYGKLYDHTVWFESRILVSRPKNAPTRMWLPIK